MLTQWIVTTLVLTATVIACIRAQLETQPQQVHLAYGDKPTEMTVTWVTLSPTPDSVVEYGLNDLQSYTQGTETTFTDGGSAKRQLFIHRVTLTGLIPGEKYLYHCGSDEGWSDIFYFKAMPDGNNWHVRLAVYGDLGNVNPQSLARLQEDTQQGMYDAVLHVGDFAYDMDTDNAAVGDSFMRQIESVAAYIPYMTCVGNHESAYNFSNYRARFSMPRAGGDGENLFYSFNIGPAHIIGFSTEVFFFQEYGTDIIANQYRWLERDLVIANLPENRAKQPWIITMGHRPMYCTNTDHDDCTKHVSDVRAELEDLFYRQGVDLALWAHEHSYERLFPLYNMTMCNGSDDKPYINPTGPVHITTGSAGCQEDHDPFVPIPAPWSAFRSDDYGYTRLSIINRTHIHWDQVSDDKDGAIIDSSTLIKNNHGAGFYTCHEKNVPRNNHTPKFKDTSKTNDTPKDKLEENDQDSVVVRSESETDGLAFETVTDLNQWLEGGRL